MELTPLQISELFSEQTRTAEGFSALVNVLLNSLMLQEGALWLNEHDDSGNGFRPHRWNYASLEFTMKVPRTREGGFTPQLLAIIRSEDDEKAHLFTSLYEKGLTTEQIGEISEQIYGRHYSKQQVSFLANKSREAVMVWLSRPLQQLEERGYKKESLTHFYGHDHPIICYRYMQYTAVRWHERCMNMDITI